MTPDINQEKEEKNPKEKRKEERERQRESEGRPSYGEAVKCVYVRGGRRKKGVLARKSSAGPKQFGNA